MMDLVLVDAQAARVRVFREALAVYRERFETIRARTAEVRARAVEERDRTRHNFAIRKALANDRSLVREEVRLHVFPSREEALKFLRREPPYEWAPRPAVVFTDLYLDGESGVPLVRQLKEDRDLREIPTIVLCCGATPGQVSEAWDAGSNAVVDLPGENAGMLGRVADTLEFWLQEAAL